MELDGKVALVLGAIKGIGKQIALALAERGVRLALNYYDWKESLPQLQREMAATGADHRILRTNLLETDRIPALVDQVVGHFGRLDILVNNIERGGWPIVHGPYTESQWDLEIHTTLRAKRWVFDACLPHLKASGDGAVINFSSIAAIVGRCGPASYVFNEGYSAASRGVSLLTETWARLGAPEVRVNEVMLGLVDTRHANGTRGWSLLTDRQQAALQEHTLLERTGRVEEVAKAVLFLIRDATFMTGAVLRMDGGYVLGGDRVAPMPKGIV